MKKIVLAAVASVTLAVGADELSWVYDTSGRAVATPCKEAGIFEGVFENRAFSMHASEGQNLESRLFSRAFSNGTNLQGLTLSFVLFLR